MEQIFQAILTAIISALKVILTPWGIVAGLVSPFSGPLAVQKVFKNLPQWLIGKKKTKRRKVTLITINALVIFLVCLFALSFEYGFINEIFFISILMALFAAILTEWYLGRIKVKNPDLAEAIRHKMWVAEEDMDLKTRVKTMLLGGGIDKRKKVGPLHGVDKRNGDK